MMNEHPLIQKAKDVLDAIEEHKRERNRAEGLARYWRHWAENYAGQAQRAEAECERLRNAFIEQRFQHYWKTQGMNVGQARIHAETDLGLIRTTPPPEGEPEQYEHLGDLSAVEPWHRVPMACERCKVSWEGCWDNYQCPRCGEGELPWYSDDAPHTPQAHGDALAALQEISNACDYPPSFKKWAEPYLNTIRQDLTASGVPYVPEEVRRLPEHLEAISRKYGRNLMPEAANAFRDAASEARGFMEQALASAPAVPELKQERLWGICMAYEKGVCVGADGTDLPDPYPEGSNDSRAYQYGLQVGRENRENRIAAAPTDGRES